MPIRGRSLGDASRVFVDHLNAVLHANVTQTPLSLSLSLEIVGQTANIHFRRGIASATAQLQTHYGPMGLYIGQLCDSVVETQNVHTLRTTNYRYALLPEGHAEPLLRWEYVRTPADDADYCRNHLQGPVRLGVIDRDGLEGNLKDWHLPTGWIMLEEMLRFCIVDLGVDPLDRHWRQILAESHRQSWSAFSTLTSP